MTKSKSAAIWLTLLNRIVAADQNFREAQKLKSLPAHRLDDMGLTREDADRAFLQHRYSHAADHAAVPLANRA